MPIEDNKNRIGDDGIPILVSILNKNITNEKVQVFVLTVLRNISTVGECYYRFIAINSAY